MVIYTGRSRTTKVWSREELTWRELVRRLSSFKHTNETMQEYKAMSKDEQSRAKDVGGFVGGELAGGKRSRTTVVSRWLVTLDADNASKDIWDDVEATWDGAICCYSTHSYCDGNPRLRFVIPLNRAVTPDEYSAISRKLAARIDIEMMDKTTYDPSRLMYWPSCSLDAVPVFHVLDGEPIDADAVLASYGEGKAWEDCSLWPVAEGDEMVLEWDREAKAEDPTEKSGLIGAFCRVYDIPAAMDKFLPGVYEPCGENRYTHVGGSSFGGAMLYDGGQFLYSYHSTDPCHDRLVNAFDLVRIHKFGSLDEGQEQDKAGRLRTVQNLPSYKAMQELADADPDVREELARSKAEEARRACEDLYGEDEPYETEDEEETDEAEEDEQAGERRVRGGTGAGTDADMDWVQQLDMKRGVTEPTLNNMQLILTHDPNLCGAFGINRMTGDLVRRRACAWGTNEIHDSLNGDLWTDADDVYLLTYLEKVWHVYNKDKALGALTAVASQLSFDPLREYLLGLKWDGTERLDTMLVRWLAAEDTAYVRAATRKWMCGAVRRALEPGSKFDSILVLTGGQGIGKSELGRRLSQGWFTDSLDRLDNSKDAQDAVRGVWIAEIAELAGMRKSEMETVKNFTSKQVDFFRPAYARCKVSSPRRCVFYGTTNDRSFLRDRTGNRRFWPVEVKGIGHGEKIYRDFGKEVDQLWAEAVVRYRAGESLFMDGELAHLAEEAQTEHAEIGEYEMLRERVIEILEKPLPEDWESRDKLQQKAYYEQVQGTADLGREPEGTVVRTKVLVSELVYLLFGETLSRGRSNNAAEVGRVMDSLEEWTRESKAIYGYKPFGRGVGFSLRR